MPAQFLIPAAIQSGLGIYQAIRGSAMKPKRPTYEIPEETKEDLAISRREANARMPGMAYAEDRLDQNAAAGRYGLTRAATNSSQVLSGLAGIQLQSNIAERGLMESEANDHYRRLANLRRSLSNMASAKDRQFQLNEMEPFQDAARTKAALIQSGLTNFAGGIGQGINAQMASNMMGGQQQQGANPFMQHMWKTPSFG